MRDLNFGLKNLCRSNCDGSYSTQAARSRALDLFANQLHDLGFRHLLPSSLKPKHVSALLSLWNSQSISTGTIKNRLSFIRWWANKVRKPGVIPNSNSHPSLSISPRVYVSNSSKAIDLSFFYSCLPLISDPHIKLSLELQAAFGLRREEALKFQPSWADKGNSIILKGSWCKGGQQREIPITSSHQRLLLDQVHSLVGSSSLIPSHRSYIQHLRLYHYLTSNVGLLKLHGLRHRYAQSRYHQLTGWLSPADGGPSKSSVLKSSSFSQLQKQAWIKSDSLARLTISNELGHHRLSVTSVYLGK